VGRARRRARLARQAGGPPAVPGPEKTARRAPDGRGNGGEGAPEHRRQIDDPAWRRAERRRVARLSRLPDPIRSWADRSRGHAAAAAVLQMLLAIALTLVGLKLTTGDWLPPYAAIVALAVAVGLQFVCRGINGRADERAGVSGHAPS
jgi:hypothetical protein